MEESTNAQVSESIDTSVTEAVVEAPAEAKKEETISEALGTKEIPKVKEPKVVPEAVFLKLKKEFKALEKSIADGATKKEVSADIKALAEKHSVDEGFLEELANVMRNTSKAEFEEELASKLAPIEAKERNEKIDNAFSKAYAKAIANAPEFEGIANKEVIKTLSLDPKNADKTFNQLIEESYGHLVTGKKTIDYSSGSNRSDDSTVDFARAQSDGEYLKKVLADPNLKKQYNKDLANRLSSVL